MSAFIAVRQAGLVHLLSDGALFTPDGIVRHLGRKVLELPCGAAFTVRGAIQTGIELADRFALFSTFDELLGAAGDILADVRERWRQVTPVGWEALLVGIANGNPSMHWWPPEGGGLRAIDDDYFAAGPMPDAATVLAVGLEPPETMADFDVLAHGLPAMEAMRRTPGPMDGCDGDVFGVGGFVSHTLVSAAGVETRVIHFWPDRIGEKIQPRQH